MRPEFVLAMRVASYWCVAVLKPVHARVVNGVPLSAPSIFSSTKSPSNSGRIVDVPLVVMPGPPGRNQNVISTFQVPDMAARRPRSRQRARQSRKHVDGSSDSVSPKEGPQHLGARERLRGRAVDECGR